jgi:hypothetical protein
MIPIAGPILLVATAVLLWYMLPKHGRTNRWATAPVLQALIPIVIVSMFGIGLILTIFRI